MPESPKLKTASERLADLEAANREMSSKLAVAEQTLVDVYGVLKQSLNAHGIVVAALRSDYPAERNRYVTRYRDALVEMNNRLDTITFGR